MEVSGLTRFLGLRCNGSIPLLLRSCGPLCKLLGSVTRPSCLVQIKNKKQQIASKLVQWSVVDVYRLYMYPKVLQVLHSYALILHQHVSSTFMRMAHKNSSCLCCTHPAFRVNTTQLIPPFITRVGGLDHPSSFLTAIDIACKHRGRESVAERFCI